MNREFLGIFLLTFTESLNIKFLIFANILLSNTNLQNYVFIEMTYQNRFVFLYYFIIFLVFYLSHNIL